MKKEEKKLKKDKNDSRFQEKTVFKARYKIR
jgi:hypothetical protein